MTQARIGGMSIRFVVPFYVLDEITLEFFFFFCLLS